MTRKHAAAEERDHQERLFLLSCIDIKINRVIRSYENDDGGYKGQGDYVGHLSGGGDLDGGLGGLCGIYR